SVSEGIYKIGTLIDCNARFRSPLKPGVVPTSCFSQVRHCRIRSLASPLKRVRNPFITSSNLAAGRESFHNSLRHHSCEYNQAAHTIPKASKPFAGGVL